MCVCVMRMILVGGRCRCSFRSGAGMNSRTIAKALWNVR